MRIPIRLLTFLLSISVLSMGVAQNASRIEATPVRLEYVVAQYLRTPLAGSLVVKNDYPSRNLGDHVLHWELAHKGSLVSSNDFSLGEILPGETKYFNLEKFVDRGIIDELGPGMLTLYAEIQDTLPDADPFRIVGVSVVLAEAEEITVNAIPNTPQRYHVIKVGGARIHRIANGNSLTLDVYNQLSALDLGKGNMFAGPLRPRISGSSLSAKHVQRLIDSLGPSQIKVDKDALAGVIQYDLDTFGLLEMKFNLTVRGLALSLKSEGSLETPFEMGFEVPMRAQRDTIVYFGQATKDADATRFGDRRLGKFPILRDTAQASSPLLSETRYINADRGRIVGRPFSFRMSVLQDKSHLGEVFTRHGMEAGTQVLMLERTVERPYGASVSRPLFSGEWLFTPVSALD